MELNELLPEVLSMECKLFTKMDSYRLIEQKCDKKCLAPDEKQRLNVDIHYVFSWLIKTVTAACPNLTEDDIVFCCLEKTGLDSITICHCMGCISKQAVNQRKYRIKKKMHEAHCDDLFELIFPCHSSPVTCHY